MHAHSHSHAQSQTNLNAAFKWAVALNATYVLVEAIGGFAVGSLSLLADAAHNLMDVAGLLIAWGAVIAARRPANRRYTYGYGRSTIMAALANALVIMIGVGAVIWEAAQRFSQPVSIPAVFVVVVATLGICVNAGTALMFRSNRHNDLNAEGAFLHMLTDAGVSLGVVIGGIVLYFTNWAWVDPIIAIGVSLLVAATTYGLLKSAFHLTLDGVPASVDTGAVQKWLCEQAGVAAIHDLHIWAISTTKTALTAHLVMPEGRPDDAFLGHLAEELEEHFNIHHATFQIETQRTDGSSSCCTISGAH